MSELRIIERFPDYAVDDEGNVWRVKPQSAGRRWKNKKLPYKLASATPDPGYPMVVLSLNGRLHSVRVHRLVCEAFHGPAPRWKKYVAHRDGTKTNNRPGNLRWCTQSENMADKIRHGTHRQGSDLQQAKISEGDVHWIRAYPKQRGYMTAMARRLQVSINIIRDVLHGVTWKHVKEMPT